MNVVWLDGEYLRAEGARLPALSGGVLYGEGLFETLRIYGGVPFGLGEHLDRMVGSAAALGIPLPAALGSIEGVALELVKRNHAPESVFRVTVLAGAGQGSHLLLSLRPLPADLEREQEQGVAAVTVAAGALPLAAHKTTSYLRNLAATRGSGAREAIFVHEGHVLEGSRSNVLAVLGRELVTPPADGRILPGVTRRILLGLAPGAGLTPRERPLAIGEMAAARALLITNSVIEVVPLATLDGRSVGRLPDPAIVRLRSLYREHVRLALGRAE